MPRPRDASERVRHLSEEKVDDLLSYFNSELTENEMRALLAKVNSVAEEAGLEAHFSMADDSEESA
ncbi:MAG TPA: hypothetical protein VFB90_01850 [Dehalococcoidia bacterium]|nr:hypothetical protein [Dehalococcoidia bacterium]